MRDSGRLPLPKSIKSVQLQLVPTGRIVAPGRCILERIFECSLKNRSPETTDASLLLVREAVLLAPLGVS